ncbi:hypothetical protein [Runella zeae]|uniref:hypothetical protein n=1 Tax=Runella zeae TaxID=94255 RepID=UPI002354C855|nr:hypothetical protein [Runella zeae]
MKKESKDADKKKEEKQVFGPCCAFEIGKLSPSGLSWKEVASREEQRIREDFRKKGIDNPSLEMMYSKGVKYIRTRRLEDPSKFQIDMEFYFPKTSPKSKDIILARIFDVQNIDEKNFIIENEHSEV